jgi:iron-sulfur cluster repair protein YtfE (RIC family)
MTHSRHTQVDRTETVNEIIVHHPASVETFNAFGIDACCGGDASVEDAARRDGADIDALLAALDAIVTRVSDPQFGGTP